jgi:hypothetical protein
MRRNQVAIFEEQQLEFLLDDLSCLAFMAATITRQDP